MPFTMDVIDKETELCEFGDRLSDYAKELQLLHDKDDHSDYLSRRAELEQDGHQFILSDKGIIHQRTQESLDLQQLFDEEKGEEYERQLRQYLQQGHRFALVANVVHEQFTARTAQSNEARELQRVLDEKQLMDYQARLDAFKQDGQDFILTGGRVYEKLKIMSSVTPDATKLQELLQEKDQTAYLATLAQLKAQGHAFRVIDGTVFELKDKLDKGRCGIRFQVKNNVINWYFIAPMDQTTQQFRDRVYETAAIAHQSVDNSCETYYRGTNHYHLRAMHTDAKESGFNHNHYRIQSGAITPKEVYQHVMAFSLTTTNRGYQGQEFVDNAKAKEIIGRYTLYWSEYAEDIRYAIFLNYLIAFETDPHDTEAIRVALNEGSRFACNLVRDLAKTGRLTPNQVVSVLDHFIQPDTAGSIIPLKILNVFDSSLKLEDLKERMQLMINEYKMAYQMHHPDYVAENDLVQIENFDRIEEEIFPSGTMGNPEKYSPRQRYLNARDQELDAIDQQEYARFSPRLIQRCRSMEDHYLGQLTPEKFRKALLLYNMLRVVQLDTLTTESANPTQIVENKFTVHESVYDIAALKSMIAQLPALQSDSTEDEIGDALLSQLVDWIVHPPEGIEAWVDYVAKNGSRGMGSEIAHVREASGAVHLHFAEMKDRDESLPGLHPINDREDIESVFAHDSNRFKRALTDMHRERNAVIIEQTVLIDFEQQLYTELEQIGSLILPTDSANESALELAIQNQRSVSLMLDVVAGLFKDQSPEALEGAEHEVNRIIGTFTGNESNEFNTVTNAMRDMIRSHIEHKAKLG